MKQNDNIIIANYADNIDEPIVIALGFFDSMHTGHRMLVNTAVSLAKDLNALPAIFTFENNHLSVMKRDTKLIYTFNERVGIYSQCGVKCILTALFDKLFMATDGEQFLNNLIGNKHVVGVVCGSDYTCGSNRKDSAFVENYCLNHNIKCRVVDLMFDNSQVKLSSTMVRQLVSNNDIVTANKLLSMPYHISGQVVRGRGVGSKLGFSTANIAVEQDKLLPNGVFAGFTTVDGVMYKCLVNVGAAPTFDVNYECVEVHIIGYEGQLYDQHLIVYLSKYIRAIVKFENAEQLINQLNSDLLEVE